jgi:hypothetical protein
VKRGGKVTGSGRKPSENNKTWKQYFNQKIFGFFLVIYERFLAERTGS